MKTRSTQATSIDAAVVASLPRPQIAWTDYCTVLLIAQHRSAAKACAPLRMTHSTLLRKLDLIETRLKTRLFERVRGCYTHTTAGQEIEQASRVFSPIADAVRATPGSSPHCRRFAG